MERWYSINFKTDRPIHACMHMIMMCETGETMTVVYACTRIRKAVISFPVQTNSLRTRNNGFLPLFLNTDLTVYRAPGLLYVISLRLSASRYDCVLVDTSTHAPDRSEVEHTYCKRVVKTNRYTFVSLI